MKARITINRYLSPVASFLLIYMFYIYLPTAFIAFTNYYTKRWYKHSFDDYRFAADLAFYVETYFLFFFLTGFTILYVSRRKNYFLFDQVPPISNSSALLETVSHGQVILFCLHKYKKVLILGLITSLFVWISFVFGGYEKLLLFGSDLGRHEYRLIGFDDRSRILTAILQIARRLTLPFCIIYLYLLSRSLLSNGSPGIENALYYLIFSLFVGIVMTLDRGPFMMIIILLFYLRYCVAKNVFRFIILMPFLFFFIILTSGFVSFVQHNMHGFTIYQVIDAGLNFIVNRAILAPSFVAIELSYGLFDFESQKLYLQYSRLTALFTGNYVGTTQDNSIYVGPVGAVADIWRNLGLTGVSVIGFLLGLYYGVIDTILRRCDPIAQVSISFTTITLVFYLVYGTFFSQGVFLQLFFIYFMVIYMASDGIPMRSNNN